MPPHPWPESALAILRREWRLGSSALAIGQMIGKTPNAVIGKAHRLGLAPHQNGVYAARKKKTMDVRFEYLGKDGCLFAVTPHDCGAKDHRFCNQPRRPGSSYCPTHHRTCYHPAPRASSPKNLVRLASVVTGLLMMMYSFTAKAAPDMECHSLPQSLKTLRAIHGETLQFTGVDGSGSILLITINPKTKSFTLAKMLLDGIGRPPEDGLPEWAPRFCPIMSGEHFQIYNVMQQTHLRQYDHFGARIGAS